MMHKANTLETNELISRLERKFQRKAKYMAERRQARYIKSALTDVRGIKVNILYEELPQYR
jgi:uncharacterized protein (UPF0305 family)